MKGHPIARIMEAWWKEHGNDHLGEQWAAYVWDFVSLITEKAKELTSEHSNLDEDGLQRFGMSKAGGCTRAAALKLLGYEAEPFSGSTLVTFFIGHMLECLGVASLRAVGYDVGGMQKSVSIDPFMWSASDGIIKNWENSGRDVILSVKTTGYKLAARNGKRSGFAALPFDGIRGSQASWWAQAQAEMHGADIDHTLVLVVAKDIIKAYERDEYLGPNGNGSLTFYAEDVPRDDEWIRENLLPAWEEQWSWVQKGKAGPAMYLGYNKYVRLPELASPGSKTSIWGGENQKATGTFNPCGACDMRTACREARNKEFRP